MAEVGAAVAFLASADAAFVNATDLKVITRLTNHSINQPII